MVVVVAEVVMVISEALSSIATVALAAAVLQSVSPCLQTAPHYSASDRPQ